jgi:hypothetical protein
MEYPHLTAEDKARFWEDGFLVKRRCFDGEEIGFVRRALVEDATLRGNIIDREEAFGARESEWEANDGIVQIMWRRAGEDLFGAISRGARLVEGAEFLLGGEVQLPPRDKHETAGRRRELPLASGLRLLVRERHGC